MPGGDVGLTHATSRGRRVRVIVAVALLCAVLGAALGWAGRQVFSPPQNVTSAEPFALVEVMEGDVGSTLALTASVAWDPAPIGVNEMSGVVTEVAVDPGATISAGDVLYRVNEQPVVALEGDVPSFRDLASGVRGDDVRQLQAFLEAEGYLTGSVDGVFGAETAAAVRSWQRDLSVQPTGSVVLGEVMFIPDLPARVRLDPGLSRADRLSGGEAVVLVYPSAPDFEVPLSAEQADIVNTGTTVVVGGPDEQWQAVVDRVTVQDDGTVLANLIAPGGGPACGESCDGIPVVGRTTFSATVELVPSVTGPMVPVAALVTGADGSYQVVLADGTRVPVTVRTQAGGYAVIDGVELGTRVRTPGE